MLKTPNNSRKYGIGYRHELHDSIMANKDSFTCLEIISEHFFSKNSHELLLELQDNFHIIPHGIGLSIGSPQLNMKHLKEISILCKKFSFPFYSEHLAITQAPGIDINHLSPIWFSEENLNIVCRNIDIIQNELGIPLVLENISYEFVLSPSQISSSQFIQELAKRTSVGFLLDITNVYVNSQNHGFDAHKYLDSVPTDRIFYGHISGETQIENGYIIDSHSEKVSENTWALLAHFINVLPNLQACILEHDVNFPDIQILIDQVKKLSTYLELAPKSGPSN